jgi:hypothetical protein
MDHWQAENRANRKMAGRTAKSVRDMVMTLIVVGIPIAFLLIILPHSAQNPVHAIDDTIQLEQASAVAPFTVVSPHGLPSGWTVTSASYGAATSGRPAVDWHIGLVTPHTTYADLEQTNGGASAALSAQAADATRDGTTTIDGVVWQRYDGTTTHALVHSGGRNATVVVAGKATMADLEVLAESLRVAA